MNSTTSRSAKGKLRIAGTILPAVTCLKVTPNLFQQLVCAVVGFHRFPRMRPVAASARGRM